MGLGFLDALFNIDKRMGERTGRDEKVNSFLSQGDTQRNTSGEYQSPTDIVDPAAAAAGVMSGWNLDQELYQDVANKAEENYKTRESNIKKLQDAYDNPYSLEGDTLLYSLEPDQAADASTPETPKERSATWGMNQGPNALKAAWDSDAPWNPGYDNSLYSERLADELASNNDVNLSDVDSIKRPKKSERNLGSQMDEWYDFLENTDLGQQIALEHPEYTRDNYGYSALRSSQDADTYALWAANDPRFARRLLSADIDANDIDNLANNIYDYMWGDNAINAYNYFTDSDSVYKLANDIGTMEELANYFGDTYNYNFDNGLSQEYGLDRGDLAAQMLARQMYSLGGEGFDYNDVSSFLARNGYLGSGEDFRYTTADSDLYRNSSSGSENARSYGSILTDEYNPTTQGIYDDYVVDTILDAMNRQYGDRNIRLASSRTPSKKQSSSEENVG